MVQWRSQLSQLVKKKAPFATGESNAGMESALESLDRGAKMNSDGFAALFRECGDHLALSHGRRAHSHMLRCGFAGERFLENLLMEMYGKCGCLDEAIGCFNRIDQPNEFSWTILITAHAHNDRIQQALRFFSCMALSGVKANTYTFVAVINACAKLGCLESGKKLHHLLLTSGEFLDSILVGNALIHMYGKCRALELARSAFDSMRKKDVVSWNSIISAFAQNGHGREALQLFREMDREPNRVTYLSAMEACAGAQDLEQGRRIHSSIDPESEALLANSIVNMYGKCRSLKEAKLVFDRIASPEPATWNTMMLAYAQNGFVKEAFEMFKRMDLEGVEADGVSFCTVLQALGSGKALEAGRVVHRSIIECSRSRELSLDNALTRFYGSCGLPDEARRLFDQMPMRNVVSWTAMMSVYVENGFPGEVLSMFRQMCLQGDRPNDVTVKTALEACSDLRSLRDGIQVHSCITWDEETSPSVGNSLMNMYSKCGEVELSRKVFDRLRKRDLFSWTAMIRAYGQSGLHREAIGLFHHMIRVEEMEPDPVAFSIALHSCTALGSLADGEAVHRVLLACSGEVRGDPVVCNSLMTMYGRCGSLAEARGVFDSMIGRDTITWNSLIKAHALIGDFDEALALFRRLEAEAEVKPDKVTLLLAINCCACKSWLEEGRRIHSISSELGLDTELVVGNTLINMYGKCGRVEAASEVFQKMVVRDVISWTSLLASYAFNGFGEEGLEIFKLMQQDFTEPNEVTFLGLFFACSHAGLVKESKVYLMSMQQDYGMRPTQEHYSCVIDLVARSGMVDEAEEIVRRLPFEPDSVVMTALLGGCNTQGDLKRGVRAAESVFEIDSGGQAPYKLMWNMFAETCMR